jgi:hypothetical protein
MFRDASAVCSLLQDSRTPERRRGRAQKNHRTRGAAQFVLGKRYTVIGAVSWAGLIDWTILEGAAGAADMQNFLCKLLGAQAAEYHWLWSGVRDNGTRYKHDLITGEPKCWRKVVPCTAVQAPHLRRYPQSAQRAGG